MISIDTKDIKRLERDLDKLSATALPFATKQTINTSAFLAQGFAKDDIKASMIQRNKFTLQSIRVNQTKSLDISRQRAFVGSTAAYMEDQEFGGTKRATGKHGVPIATSFSAGQGFSRNRTKLPTRPNKLRSIQLRRNRGVRGNREVRNIWAIHDAKARGYKFVFLDLGRAKGIFKVVGSKKFPKIVMVHDMSRKSVRIPRNPWLKPAVDLTGPLMSSVYTAALRFQIKRLQLFKNR